MQPMNKEILKKYGLPAALALLQWGIWQIRKIGRSFLSFNPGAAYTVVQKGLFLCLLCALWCFLFYVAREVRGRNRQVRRGLFVFCVYFLILMAMLALLWPGCWYWDDIGVLASARNYEVLPWQHVLSSFFQTLFLQLVPVPGGVILVQLFIDAVIVAYAVSEFEQSFCGGELFIKYALPDTLLKLIPFLLPPVIFYQYSGFRMGFYIFIEIFVLAFSMGISEKKGTVSPGWLFTFALAVAVLSTWRTEGFLYAPVMILIILVQKENVVPLKRRLLTAVLIILGIAVISSFQKMETGDDNYSVVTVLRPLCEAVRAADPEADADLLKDIDAVVDTELMWEKPEVNGEDLLWKHDLKIKDYSEQEYGEFMNAFVKLCMRYPKAVAKERIKVFLDTSAILGRTNPTNVVGAYYLFDPEEQNDNQKEFTGWDIGFNRPLSEGLRQRFILFEGCLREDFSERITYRIVWNIIIPILVIFAFWGWCFMKKKWMLFLPMSAVALRIPVLFLTAPATWTMYYLSFYLTGYVLLVVLAMIRITGKVRR